MNKVEKLLSDIKQTDERLNQLEANYENKPLKGEIYHKTLRHLKLKKKTLGARFIKLGSEQVVLLFKGNLRQGDRLRKFEIALVDLNEEEAKQYIEILSAGKVEDMVITTIETGFLKFS